MVKFQSQEPLQWIDAAYMVRISFKQTDVGVFLMKDQHNMDPRNMKKERRKSE